VTPLERLLAATEQLVDDLSTAVLSHMDLHLGDGTGSAARKAGDEMTAVAKGVTEAFAVGTETQCHQADTGTKGEVCVPVPVATYPLPLAVCKAMAIVPGQLPGYPATPVTAPTQVMPGEDVVDVSISATLAPGLYAGHLADSTGNVQRPFLIFLDGLT
jgi:hypothetical protein